MMPPLFLDLETFSERAIRSGVYAYAEVCEVLLFAYAIGDGPVKVWQPQYEPIPEDLGRALASECVVVAHNAMFDRTALRLGNLGIDIAIPRWRCTMTQAMAHSLPGKLDTLCGIMGVGEDDAKVDGKAYINLFCKPRPKNSKIRRATRDTHPDEWAGFVRYAGRDISAMRVLYRKLPRWNYSGIELDFWHLDQEINDRGVCVDLGLSRAAVDSQARIQQALAAEATEATKNEETGESAVTSTTQRDALLQYILAEYGVALPDMRKDTLERRFNDPDLPEAVRHLIGLRLEASKTSGTKHNALLKGVSADGRLRGLLRFCGAMRTGRWSGQLFQPQNLSRPPAYLADEEYDRAVDAITAGAVDLLYDKPLEVIGGTVRGALVAAPGKKLVIADLSNIEGRMAAWLAGEAWKLDKFREFDAGHGADLYKVSYAGAFQISPEDVNKFQRQIGKVMELMLQYEGGVGAFLTGAAGYGIDLDELARLALPVIPADVIAEAEGLLQWLREKNGKKPGTHRLPDDVFVACDSLKRLWRRAHEAISGYWPELKSDVIHAIQNPGQRVECRKVTIQYKAPWLGIKLPSGRVLCYPHAGIEPGGKIVYHGVNQYTRKWGPLHTYGGKLLENITQAASRDVMAWAMPEVEHAGYEIVLSVHDELVTEAPDSPEFNSDHLASLLATNPTWAPDLPLAAAGFETYRYRKD